MMKTTKPTEPKLTNHRHKILLKNNMKAQKLFKITDKQKILRPDTIKP